MRSNTLRCAAIAAIVALAAPATRAQLQFSIPTNYPLEPVPVQVVVGDFNGDGKLDVAVLTSGKTKVCVLPCNVLPTLSILLGNGDGTFQPAITSAYSTFSARSMAVGDFNGDGKLDLAVANGPSGTVSVMLGNGDGTFQPAALYNIGSSADFVAVADFNNDNKLDLLVSTGGGEGTSNPTSGSIAILLGKGDGTFQAAINTSTGTFTGTTPYVAVADFNGDGKLDVATGNAVNQSCIVGGNCEGGNVLVFLGNGDGSFQSPVTSTVDFAPIFLATGDLNGNGKADLAIIGAQAINNSPLPASHNQVISTVLGKGDGTFRSTPFLTGLASGLCQGATNLVVADLNGDGKLDLIAPVAVSTNCSGTSFVGAFLGNGDGTFQPALDFDLASAPGWLAVGDFTADTLPDLVLSNNPADSVSVLLNTTPTFMLAAQSSSLTVTPGNPQTDVLSLAGVNGFASPVDLACTVSGPEPLATCSLSTSSVTPGVNPGTSSMTITAPMTAATRPESTPKGVKLGVLACALALPVAFGIVFVNGSKRRQRTEWMLCGLLGALCGLQAACGGSGRGSGPPPSPAAEMFTVTVTATSGTIQEITQVAVTVP